MQAELRDERPVPLDVVAPEVVEQSPTLTHEHEQPTAAVMVLLVDLQVLGEVGDAVIVALDGIVLAAGSDRGNEVMAHVGARTDLPLAANCTVSPPA